MKSAISLSNAQATLPVLFQLENETTIFLINSEGNATCVYVDEEKNPNYQLGDIISSFCRPGILPEKIDLSLGKVLPLGTEITLKQSS